MSHRLKRRVRNMGHAHRQAPASFVPVAPGMTVSGSAASPSATSVMPLARVLVYPHPGDGYSTIAYQGLAPIYTATGEAVPASAPGRWGQLVSAGRP